MVSAYSQRWEIPGFIYTAVINGFAFVLMPTAILLTGYDGHYQTILVNLFLFILVTPVFCQCMMKSIYLSEALQQAGEAVGRLNSLLDFPTLPTPAHPQKVTRFDIRFDHVYFTYPDAKQPAVNGISFVVPQGETVALVGASGSGKTTVAQLLPRFYDEILIGGVNVKNIDHMAFV
jgi:ATP-binding cassette subfamily B protein